MLEAAGAALAQLADPSMLLFLLVGVVVGLVIGVIPGLGGTGAVAVLIPFVFVLEPEQAIAMIIGSVAVVHTSDVITSVVLGIPGSASASVFLLDGHEMAKQGQGGRALSASFISSTIGGLIGLLALTVIIPIAEPVVTAFGSPEIFALIIMGVFLTAVLSQGNMVKGLVVSVFGLMLGLVGISPVSAEYRYTFGSEYLTEGIGLVAAALGIFGVAEIIDLVAQRASVASKGLNLGGGWARGARDIADHKGEVLRGSAIGTGLGILPGVGSTAGTWLAYGQAKANAARKKQKSTFGKGDPRGVIAPSAADNSIESGSLIPTLLFGVPGAAPFALLLGVLLIFGIQPGPGLISNDLDLVYFIVWSFAIAAIVGAILAFFMSRPLAQLSFVRFPVLAAALIPILFMSGFQEPLNLTVFYTMLVLGIVGWLFKITNIPRAPFLIAFVLATPLERYYFITVNAFSPAEWMSRPFVLVAAAIIVASIVFTVYANRRRSTATAPREGPEEGDWVPPFFELGVSVAGLAFFALAIILAQDFSPAGRLFPYVVGGIGLGLTVFSLVRDIVRCRQEGGVGRLDEHWRSRLTVVGLSVAWILGFVWLVFLFGMLVGTAVFAFVFLLAVARMKIIPTTIYTAAIVGSLFALAEFASLVSPTGYLL